MEDIDPGTGEELAPSQHFLVEQGQALFLVSSIQRYHPGHPEWTEVQKLFEAGYGHTPLRATRVKEKQASSAATAEMSFGAITMQIDLDDR
jgi:hypothetical protein